MAVLKNEWEKAIKLVLSSLSEEDQVKCQNHLRHSPKDFRGAADRLGFRCHIEKNLLNCLHKYHGDPKQAFQVLACLHVRA
ncbi:hypothetical protein SARC_05351 [Sphaeroforma arctica JP610]|uniref:Uncharacterized protein n=1 Tax=Sphaeroforma arctica JP610 TaxID=667725 RepID=A0A0L0G2E0_9EUKA|nr:hypothetical protein SARC_05351 [Sphaeroforma arctica JP610]KNC82358.1 hypothetical protein SARC_05351 [Sphaeroforma arctica JP610]|eukprot:XP_014156260.1 hypothetical protein SARC_05351 [Sphaeroforma arctica JP610]